MLKPLGNTEKSMKGIRLWDEAFDELDRESKLLFLHRIKLVLDISMEDRVMAFREYEQLRFKIINRPDRIALEGYCENCKKYITVAISIIDYIHNIQLSSQPIMNRYPIYKKDQSFLFPVLF